MARWYRRLFLAIALLLAQHAGAMHALSHQFETGDAAPGHGIHACCVVYHGLDDATPATPATLVLSSVAPAVDVVLPGVAPQRAGPYPYHSRAPPSAA